MLREQSAAVAADFFVPLGVSVVEKPTLRPVTGAALWVARHTVGRSRAMVRTSIHSDQRKRPGRFHDPGACVTQRVSPLIQSSARALP